MFASSSSSSFLFLAVVAAAAMVAPTTVSAFSLSSKPVSVLLSEKAPTIASLKEIAAAKVDITQEPYANDVFFLRYCLNDEPDAAITLASNLEWRTGEGASICDAAQTAIAAATNGGGWTNGAVSKAAPSSDKILKYLTPSNILTTTSSKGDLLLCILAGCINDVDMMGSLDSVDEMINFFVYAKEVNCAVANTRSVATDRLHCLLTANSLEGVKLVGGDATFRTALSASSKVSDPLYPNMNGPTLLLNLPKLLGALVKLFTPLFPAAVKERLRFESGPLKGSQDLTSVVQGGADREAFLADIDQLVY